MSDHLTSIHDRLEDILESIELIQEWSMDALSMFSLLPSFATNSTTN